MCIKVIVSLFLTYHIHRQCYGSILIFSNPCHFRHRDPESVRSIIPDSQHDPVIDSAFGIIRCIFPELLCCHRQIFRQQTFKLFPRDTLGTFFRIYLSSVFFHIKVFIQSVKIQSLNLILRPFGAQKIISLISDNIKIVLLHLPVLFLLRLYPYHLVCIHDLRKFRRLCGTVFENEPSFLRIFPLTHPRAAVDAESRLHIICPSALCIK